MATRHLTQEEHEQIYLRKKGGENLQTRADEIGISYDCARKGWRRGKREGLAGLVLRKRGRPVRGLLAQFAPEVREASLSLKQKPKHWGAVRILLGMKQMDSLAKRKLPSRGQLYIYFREHCPDSLNIWTKHKEVPCQVRATAVHAVWQGDHQEGHRLGDESSATVCTVRDPCGAAMIASQALEVKTEKHWRKLTWEEVRQVLRTGFCEWQTLPDSVQTDREMGLGSNSNAPFPSGLSLYLAGLGIKPVLLRSHRPTDQAQIEHSHRAIDGLTDDEESRQTITDFGQTLDHERAIYTQQFPARASDCQQEAPLKTYPALLMPRRIYHPGWDPSCLASSVSLITSQPFLLTERSFVMDKLP